MEKAVPARPDDLAIEYQWREGTLPPPDHYEYMIQISREAKGRIEFRPDYPKEDVPVWTEDFAVDEETLEQVYRLMVDKGVFHQEWKSDERIPPGDRIETLEVTSQDNHIHVPANIQNQADISDVYTAIRKLVPHTIWESLMAKRDQYMNIFFEEE